jgi:glyoxylase-like metal-dependent hydrolase (beta-lactamase superfamily II)
MAESDPLKIDYVINTHLHFDHIGWNTIFKNGRWAPTFPNARYIVVKEEFDYWRTFPKSEVEDDLLSFKDSVLPVYKAGLIDLVSSDHKLLNTITLLPTPGHTPFHGSILIESEGKQAVIVGDVFHHPCQIAQPQWKSTFDTDSNLAIVSRRKLLKQFANTNTLFLAAHFNTAGYLTGQADNYKLVVE